MNHLKKGSLIPAISCMDVNVFSSIRADTYNREQFSLLLCSVIFIADATPKSLPPF
jgi:hypothetical protein